MALRLRRTGFTRVRPLQGGLNLWMERQFPVEALVVPTPRERAKLAREAS